MALNSGSDVVFVSCFGGRVSVMFHFMFVHYTFSSVWVAEWPPFEKKLTRSVSNLFSLCFVYLLYLFIPRFGFKSGVCLLIAPVPVHCFSITFSQGQDMTLTFNSHISS